MSRLVRVIYAVVVVGLAVVILSHASPDGQSPAPADVPLDYSKPVFTTSITIVCPISVFFDMRTDHAPEKLVEMFTSIWSRDEKAKELGCEELQAGIRVTATHLVESIASIRLPGSSDSNLFTLANELTNKVPGQSNAQRNELAVPHVNTAVSSPSITRSDGSSPTIGNLIITTPSRQPILKGAGVAASDSTGSGAIICPDDNAIVAFIDSGTDHFTSGKSVDQWTELKEQGCSYVPPGTGMNSEGPNRYGSLVIVAAKLPDGTLLHGVTFPYMFVLNQQQQDKSSDQTTSDESAQGVTPTNAVAQSPSSKATDGSTSHDVDKGPFYPGKDGVGYPTCIYCPDPKPTQQARKAKIKGTVTLRIIIEPDGHPSDIQVVKSLGHGLDEMTVLAIENWRFKAAIGPNGIAVPTVVPVEVKFNLN